MFKNLKNEQENWKPILCLLILSLFLGMNTMVNSLLSKIMFEYPEIPATTIRLFTNAVSLIAAATSLLISPLLGKKIGYKPVMLTGTILCLVAGVAPAVIKSFTVMLIVRGIYGVGFGLVACRIGYIMLLAAKGTEAKFNSNCNMFTNFAGVGFTLLAGIIGDYNWRYVFILFALLIIPFIYGLGSYKEPVAAESGEKAKEEKAEKQPLSFKTWKYAIFHLILTVTSTIWMVGSSQLLVEKGMSSSFAASIVISACSLGGACASFVFQFFNKRNQRIMAPFAAICNALTLLIAYFTKSLAVLTVCSFVAGVGFIMSLIMSSAYSGLSNHKSNMTTATVIINSCQTGGMFLTGYYIEFCSKVMPKMISGITYTASAFIFSAAVLIVVAIVSCFVDFRVKQQ